MLDKDRPQPLSKQVDQTSTPVDSAASPAWDKTDMTNGSVQIPINQFTAEKMQRLHKSELLNPHGEEHEQLRVIRDRLAAQSGVVIKLGRALLSAGASAYLVKLSMARLAHAIGLEEHHSQVTFSEIVTSAYGHNTFRTESSEQRAFGTNAARLDDLRAFVRDLRPGMLIEDVNQRLDQIMSRPPVWSAPINCLSAGIACGCFCFLNRGGIVECSVVALAALFGQLLRRTMMHRHMNHFGVWMLCALVSSSLYIGITEALYYSGLVGSQHPQGMVSAVLFLVPGFPLVTAILDLVRMDFSAGISRITYVLMLVISAAISVWAIGAIFQWPIDPPSDFPVSGPMLIILQAACSLVASYGFAVLFSCKPRLCLIASLIAAFINPCRLALVTMGLTAQSAVGLASISIGMLAHFISRFSKYRYSRVSLSVPAVVIMIPGVPLYVGMAHLSEGELQLAAEPLVQVCFVILSIGIGLAISRMITDPGWRFDRDTAKRLRPEDEIATSHTFRMR